MTLDDEEMVLLVAALEEFPSAAGGKQRQYLARKCNALIERIKQYREDRKNGDA